MAVLLGGALLAVGLVAAVEVTGFGERDRLPTGVIATVDGIEVTELEWEEAMLLATLGLSFQRMHVEEMPDYLETMPGMRAYAEEMLALMEEYPVEVLAIAIVVSNHAIYAEVKRRGFAMPDEAEVQAQVDQQREITTKVLAGEFGDHASGTEYLRIVMDHFGEDRYFDEYVPMVMRRVLATEPLHVELVQNPQTWEEFTRDLIRRTRFNLGVELRAQFSEDDVREYQERSASIVPPWQSAGAD